MTSYQLPSAPYPTASTTTTQPPRVSLASNDHLVPHSHSSASQHESPDSNSNPNSSQNKALTNSTRAIDNDPPPPRPLTSHEQDMIAHLDRLKFFLATAPSHWSSTGQPGPSNPSDRDPSHHHPALNRFLLPSGEYVSCVLWGGLYHITGTDIVRALVFRFEAFARPVRNMKKFEEGVFSDLRNLKPGNDACLEEPKSPFLDLLFKYQCIRTQKKQKVFYWFSVPHDRLFLDALERDLKREKMGLEPTTVVVGEPARSFRYDPKRSLYEQFSKARGGIEGEGDLERVVREADAAAESATSNHISAGQGSSSEDEYTSFDDASQHRKSLGAPKGAASGVVGGLKDDSGNGIVNAAGTSQFHSMFTLFEGSPTYKLRRKKANKASGLSQSQAPGNEGMHGPNGSGGSASDMGYDPEYRDRRASSMEELYGNGPQPAQTMYPNDYRRDSDMSMSPHSTSHRPSYGPTHYSAAMIPAAPLSAPLRTISNLPSQPFGQSPIDMHHGPMPPLVPSIPQVPQMAHHSQSVGGYGSIPPYSHSHSHLHSHPHYSRASTGSSGISGFVPSPPARGIQVPASAPAHLTHFPQVYEDDMTTHSNGSLTPGHMEQSPLPSPMHHQVMSNGHAHGADGMGFNLSLNGEGNGLSKGTKGFVCPLYSCGRHFKRMEHLKRHLRVHTAERPYECSKCHKRFSRSDNLNQHFRTHSRSDGTDASGAGVKTESASADEEDGIAGGDAHITDSEAEQNEFPPHDAAMLDGQMQLPTSVHVREMGEMGGVYVPPTTMQSQHSQHSQDAPSVYEGSVGYETQFAHAVDEQTMPFTEMQQSPFEQPQQPPQPWHQGHQRSLPVQLEAYHHSGTSPAYSVVSNSISSSPPHPNVSMHHSVAPSASLSLNGSPVSRYGSPSEASVVEQRSASVSHIPSNAMYMQSANAASSSALSAPSHKLAFDQSNVPMFNGIPNSFASVRRHRSATPVASFPRSMSVGANAAADIRRTSWHVVGGSHGHGHHGQGRFHPYSPSQLNAARGYTEEPDTPFSVSASVSASATEFPQPVGLSADAVAVGPTQSDAQISVDGMMNLQIQQQGQAAHSADDMTYDAQARARAIQQNVVAAAGAGGEYVEVVVEEPQIQVAPQQPPQQVLQQANSFPNVVAMNGNMYGLGSHHQPMDQFARPTSYAHPQLTL